MIFDILRIKHEIEERRLILGRKIENFLLKKIHDIADLIKSFFNREASVFWVGLFIILTSLHIQSSQDIGNISATHIIQGLPLNFIGNFSSLNQTIFLQTIINFLGILSIFLSYKILKKSALESDKIAFNLLILSFIVGFFFRNYDLLNNEFLNSSTFFLIFFYPLLSLFLVRSNKTSQAISTFAILVPILFLLATPLSESVLINFATIKQNLFPILLFLFLLRKEIEKNKLLKNLFFIIIILSITSIVSGDFVVLNSIFLSQIFLTFYFIHSQIDFKKDWAFIIPILIIFQFNSEDTTAIALNLCCFWWLFVLFARRNNHQKKHVFLPNDFNSWLGFLVMWVITINLLLIKQMMEIGWIISALIFFFMIDFYQDLNGRKKFIRLFSATIIAVLAYVIQLNLAIILKHDYEGDYIKSEITKESLINAQNQEITIIENSQNIGFQSLIYTNKPQSLIFNKNQNLEILKSQLLKKENKLIFIFNDPAACEINSLESFLRDSEFKLLFKNYKFLNQIIAEKKSEKEFVFFAEKEEDKNLVKPIKTIAYNVEIYIKN